VKSVRNFTGKRWVSPFVRNQQIKEMKREMLSTPISIRPTAKTWLRENTDDFLPIEQAIELMHHRNKLNQPSVHSNELMNMSQQNQVTQDSLHM
jgi:hypothetical protein